MPVASSPFSSAYRFLPKSASAYRFRRFVVKPHVFAVPSPIMQGVRQIQIFRDPNFSLKVLVFYTLSAVVGWRSETLHPLTICMEEDMEQSPRQAIVRNHGSGKGKGQATKDHPGSTTILLMVLAIGTIYLYFYRKGKLPSLNWYNQWNTYAINALSIEAKHIVDCSFQYKAMLLCKPMIS